MRESAFAARALVRARGFTAAIVGTLALGLAVALTTFAVVNAYMLRSMPYAAAERLYHVVYAPPGSAEPEGMSGIDWAALSDVVEQADASAPTRVLTGVGAGLEELMGLSVDPGSVALLGVRAALGRSLTAGDFAAAAEPVALIGHELWRDRFGGEAAAVGRLLRLRAASGEEAQAYRIVGVLPPDFRYARDHARGAMSFVVPLREPGRSYMVRLRDGVPAALAEGRISAAARSVAQTLPPNWPGVRLESVHARYVSGLRPALRALALASAFVLLIVAANASVLMLLRTLRRSHELAVRAALGARRADVLRMLTAEVVLICAAAWVAALAATHIALRALAPIVEERLGRAAPGGTAAIAVDGTVLLLACAACAGIALGLSYLPMRIRRRHEAAASLRGGARSGLDTRTLGRARGVLVGAEIAASLALLVGGGLMARTVANLAHTDLGVRTEGIARVRIALPVAEYADVPSFARFYDPLDASLPRGAFAFTDFIPFYEPPSQEIALDAGGPAHADAPVLAVSDAYFDLFGVTIAQGRGFDPSDRPGAEPVAVVSASFARAAWPGAGAIGRRVRTAHDAESSWRTVVGVARDVRQTHTDADQRDVYVPFRQAPGRFVSLYFREDLPPFASWATLRATVAAVDPRVLVSDAVTGLRSLPAEEERQLAGPRFLRSVLAAFAALATLLTALAVYGVTAYAVQQREYEVAIRMALGASPRTIVSMFVRESGAILLTGTVCGLAAAFGVSRLLSSQLHGVAQMDPATLAGASAITLAAALLATLWPLRRASAVELRSLRGE